MKSLTIAKNAIKYAIALQADNCANCRRLSAIPALLHDIEGFISASNPTNVLTSIVKRPSLVEPL